MGRSISLSKLHDVLLLQSSNVMRKSMPIHTLIERLSLPDSWHQRGMQWHCITVCKLALCISASLWQLVRFLEVC